MSAATQGRRPLVVANCSGFLGDRLAAAREQVDGGAIDVLTGDWLAELTMLVLARQRLKHGPGSGYARPFLLQLEQVLGTCLDRGIRVVSNAGGLDPTGLADAVTALAGRLGLQPRVGVVSGDDVAGRADLLGDLRHMDTGQSLTADLGLHPLTANAYLGGFGIAAALGAGADVVVTGRVTDAAVVTGPAAWWHGWRPSDLDPLAGAVVAGHVIECGAQATGGNYPFAAEVPGLEHVAFPIAEIAADGSSVITKHPGTGGCVSVGTVTAQLLYEIGGPRYLGPDVTARFDTVELVTAGPDRVAIRGVRGEPPPTSLKVAVTALGGFRNAMTVVLTGLDREAKADLVLRQLAGVLSGIRDVTVHRVPAGDHRTELRLVVQDPDRERVGRAFSAVVVELMLASAAGVYPTSPPGDATPYGLVWPVLVDAGRVVQQVAVDGVDVAVPPPPAGAGGVDAGPPTLPEVGARSTRGAAPATATDGTDGTDGTDETRRVPLGTLVGARSGDKAGDANVGCWVREPAAYDWLVATVTADAVRTWVPEAADCPVDVHPLPNLLAVNVVIRGLLGFGVSANAALDPQAKGLGELIRACLVDVPVGLLPAGASS